MIPPPTERMGMGQIDVTSKSRTKQRAGGVKARIENFLRTFEWTWTSAVTFALVLTFFLLISTSIMPSFWMYYAEQKIGWAGPTDIEAFLKTPFGTGITNPLSPEGYLMVRDAIATAPLSRLDETIEFFVGPKRTSHIPVAELIWFMLLDSIHHRGQLSVFLRAMHAKVPSIYGPSADEPWM